MSQLIQLKRRIKAITTIKKITSAMRLISRSIHARFDKKKKFLFNYHATITDYMTQLRTLHPHWAYQLTQNNHATEQDSSDSQNISAHKDLFIIIGSQKDLCGNFNSPLYYWIDSHNKILSQQNTHIISYGKKISDYLKKRSITIFQEYKELKPSILNKQAEDLLHTILPITSPENFTHKQLHTAAYNSVTLVYLSSKTFFNRTLQIIPLLPLITPSDNTQQNNQIDHAQAYLTHNKSTRNHTFEADEQEHTPEEILYSLSYEYLRSCIYIAFFQSLHAEQSARFISMDNATRNAETFLTSMKSHYNKMRQAKITKELAELSGAFDS